MKRIGPVAGVIALALTLATAGVAPAVWASPTGGIVRSDSPDGYGGSDPAVLAKLAELRAAGAEVISVTQTSYKPAGSSSKVVSPQALPSGCGLTVIVSRSGRVIDGSSITSCSFAFTTGTMNSTMTHYNPDWGIWDSTVAYGNTATAVGTIMHLDIYYNCANGNLSNYRNTAVGSLYVGSTHYTAAAYDVFNTLQPCGT